MYFTSIKTQQFKIELFSLWITLRFYPILLKVGGKVPIHNFCPPGMLKKLWLFIERIYSYTPLCGKLSTPLWKLWIKCGKLFLNIVYTILAFLIFPSHIYVCCSVFVV